MQGNNQTRNHKLEADCVVYRSNTVSRSRCRITVNAMRKLGIKPAQRVQVEQTYVDGVNCIKVTSNPKGNYKVERDGSLRFSSNLFPVRQKGHFTQADNTMNAVVIY
jgi:hypothetical protein